MASEADWYRITEPSLLAEHLIANAEERRLRLLACAVLRYAPFDDDGKSIWNLAADFTWVRDNQFAGRPFGFHEAICAIEKAADGECDTLEREEATQVCHLAEYRAEGDYIAASEASVAHEKSPGCSCRYALARLIHSVASKDAVCFMRSMYHWWLKPDAEILSHAKHPMLQPGVCDLIRDIFPPPWCHDGWYGFHYDGEAVQLAKEIYRDRQFDRISEIGKILEMERFRNEDAIRHCFEQPVHTRGCWVLDGLIARNKHALMDRLDLQRKRADAPH